MSELANPLPNCRRELVFNVSHEAGSYIVKNPRARDYYSMGEAEYFLLQRLDGAHSAQDVCAEFEVHFGEPLTANDLAEFLDLAGSRGFLESASPPETHPSALASDPPIPSGGQTNLVYWRKSLFDPDALFNWLEPKLRFVWTWGFLVFLFSSLGFAAVVVVLNGQQLATSFAHALHWKTALAVALVLALVTIGHEFAHGLTCKHFGGETHEIGFLMLLLMPCLYCNVSDAWMFPRKSQRIWVTLAGGLFELLVWSLAVFIWRLSMPDTMVNYLAFVVVSVCGVRTMFNFNPLIKLDGYYLLGDLLNVSNLHPRAASHFKSHVRRLLWGGQRLAAEPRGRWLFVYGLASWLCAVAFISIMLLALFRVLWPRWGWPGAGAVALLGLVTAKGMLQGFSAGEVHSMITKRRKRAVVWGVVLAGIAAAMFLIEIPDVASGSFRTRAATRADLRAPLAGFLTATYFGEGDRVSAQSVVARLEVTDLASRLTQTQAEAKEIRANLRMLEIGTRPEEIAEQRARVARSEDWANLAHEDLSRAKQALQQEFSRMDYQIKELQIELENAAANFRRAKQVRAKGALAEEQYRDAERAWHVTEAKLAQAQSQKRHRQLLGTREAIAGLDAEAELARRQKDLADDQATLALMEAGSRPDAIEAEQARLMRLEEEIRHLEEQQSKLAVVSGVEGIVTTAHLNEKVGQYLHEGELICSVEEPGELAVEIDLAEQEASRIGIGQDVELKARALPFQTFNTKVDRIAPIAGPGDLQSTVTVYCRLQRPPEELRPQMTGYARVYKGHRPLGEVVFDKALRFIRTEFWW